MKNNFDAALSFVLRWEGGYTDGKTGASRFDNGGATNQGITEAVYNDWRIGRGLGRQPVAGLSKPERDAIYRQRYWDAVRGDDLPAPLDMVLFDAAVNAGPKQAIKWLQRAVGAQADGALGPVTMAALNNLLTDAQLIARSINVQREEFYIYLAKKDPKQAVFLKGWLARVDGLEKTVFA